MHDGSADMGSGAASGGYDAVNFAIPIQFLNLVFGLLQHGIDNIIPAVGDSRVVGPDYFEQIQIHRYR